jgi:hypothetical protein
MHRRSKAQCPFCGGRSSSNGRSSTGERRFVCRSCKRKFGEQRARAALCICGRRVHPGMCTERCIERGRCRTIKRRLNRRHRSRSRVDSRFGTLDDPLLKVMTWECLRKGASYRATARYINPEISGDDVQEIAQALPGWDSGRCPCGLPSEHALTCWWKYQQGARRTKKQKGKRCSTCAAYLMDGVGQQCRRCYFGMLLRLLFTRECPDCGGKKHPSAHRCQKCKSALATSNKSEREAAEIERAQRRATEQKWLAVGLRLTVRHAPRSKRKVKRERVATIAERENQLIRRRLRKALTNG